MNSTSMDMNIVTQANGLLVALSYVISALGVFTCFQIVSEVKFVSNKLVKLLFVFCASVAISMGYVALGERSVFDANQACLFE